MDFNFNPTSVDTASREQQMAMSQAFPALMRKVYVWMSMALVITAFAAYYVASSPALVSAIFGNKILFWGLIISEFAIVVGISAALNRLSLTAATLLFVLYSAINGVTLASIFFIYDPYVIVKTFFITAATFAATAAAGYFIKRDLSFVGRIAIMALIGIIIASIVNVFFLKSTGLDLVISYAGVLIFVGLTAYDSQKIKQMLLMAPDQSEASQKLALMGALSLYLDFINLFIYLLRIFGSSRD